MKDFDLNNYQLQGEELKIYTYPDPVLSEVAKPVAEDEFNEDLKKLCINMLYTMYHAPGIGLAAPQVGISKRIFVIDVNYDREEEELANGDIKEHLSNFQPHIFINPVIKDPEGKRTYQEGCLSLPGIFEDVVRADTIILEYQDLEGNKHEMKCEGLLSTCVQHENDHLEGIVFIDHLSTLKKNFFRKKLIKVKKRIEV